MKKWLNLLVMLLVSIPTAACVIAFPESEARLERIKLPAGFKIEMFAERAPGARSLALGKDGTVFVGTRETGKVYALPDADRDGRPDRVVMIAQGLNMPNGVAFRNGALYVAEINRILRFDGIESSLDKPPKPVVVNDSFPEDRHHGWKYIAFGPDGLLYVPVGAPCNNCLRDDPRYASIMRLDIASGGKPEVFAHGVRNTVGFDWHPGTGELWFTDNGRDWMGDDAPPDELNRAPKPGLNFGFPFCQGGLADPEFGQRRTCAEFEPPTLKLGPHVAALGMKFYTGGMFPPEYRNQIFMAEHGSWNRTTPLGYRITLGRFQADGTLKYEVFADGWLSGDSAWGRPVDILVMPDGSLLVSDDRAGAVYRISYRL